MKKNILIATDRDFLASMKGSHNRINSYYEFLSKNYNVNVMFMRYDKFSYPDNCFFFDRWLPKERTAVLISQPYTISWQVRYEFKLAFDNYVENCGIDYDYIIIPYIWMSYLAENRPKTNAKFIIDTHDSFSERTKNFKENGFEFSSSCTEEEEKKCLELFDYIMAISSNEEKIFKNMGFKNVFTAKYFCKHKKIKKKLGFIGSGSVHNINALEWFYKNCFKDKLDDDYLLYICGDVVKTPEIKNKILGKKGIVCYQSIWNIEDFYNMIDIAINPCQIGSGLKIKNIEALSFNKPVITTSIGAQGMDEELSYNHILKVADNPNDFINEIKGFDWFNFREAINLYDINNTEKKIYKELLEIIENE